MPLKTHTPIFYKTVHYGSDGSGRDTYVLIDNGGFESKRPIMKLPSTYNRSLYEKRRTINP